MHCSCAKIADERKFGVEPFSFKLEYSSDGSELSSDEVQSGEDESNRLSH